MFLIEFTLDLEEVLRKIEFWFRKFGFESKMDKKVANTQEQQQPEVSDGGIQSCLSIRDKSESETSQTDKKLSDSVGVDSSRLKDKDKSADDEIIEIDKTFNENICEDFGYDEKLNSLKVISEGHGTLKTDLQIALFDLAEKEGQQKDCKALLF